MARLEVELDNITDVLKKKWNKAKNTLEKIDIQVPTDLSQLLQSAYHFLGVPSLRDFEKLNKKVDQLSKSKTSKTAKKS